MPYHTSVTANLDYSRTNIYAKYRIPTAHFATSLLLQRSIEKCYIILIFVCFICVIDLIIQIILLTKSTNCVRYGAFVN